jgi:hypothetical protein
MQINTKQSPQILAVVALVLKVLIALRALIIHAKQAFISTVPYVLLVG